MGFERLNDFAETETEYTSNIGLPEQKIPPIREEMHMNYTYEQC